MPLPCGLLDTLLFLGVLCRLLDALLLGLLLFVWVLLLSLLLLLLFVLVLLLGLLLLRLFVLVLLLGLLLLRLFVLVLLLAMLLLWPGFLLFVLCERRNNGSERQKKDCCSESCKCFHWYCLNYKSRRTSDE